jgi:hypothetical protein
LNDFAFPRSLRSPVVPFLDTSASETLAKMELRRSVLLILLCLAALGCRKDPYMDAYFEMLNSEKRVLEDRLYALEYDYKKALKELEECRTNNPAGDRSGRSEPDRDRELEPPLDDRTDEPLEPEIPEIELPPGFESSHQQSPKQPAFRTASTAARQADADGRVGSRKLNNQELAQAVIAALDRDIDHVVINTRTTGGSDFDEQPGDDGLTVLIEPRTKQGHFVAESGAVSVVVLDPALSGPAARVARWDIDASAARRALRTDSLDRGLLLQLPWSDSRPEHERLSLFVRFHTADGRVLETEQPIRVQPAQRVAQSWTPRSPRTAEDKKSGARIAGRQDRDRTPPAEIVQASAEEQVRVPAEADNDRPTAESQKAEPSDSPGRFWKPQR